MHESSIAEFAYPDGGYWAALAQPVATASS
jgi:hypothetical protein